MKRIKFIAVIAVLVVAPGTYAIADHDGALTTPAAALLYLDQSAWEQTNGEGKAVLAADFMRVFCGNPAMPPADLVGCLDRGGPARSMFERAMTCLATGSARQPQ